MHRDVINPTSTMEWVVNRMTLPKGSSAQLAGLDACLQRGWDITTDIRRVDDPGVGVYRAPHFLSEAAVKRGQTIGHVILAPGMTASEIEADLYRQARVYPTDHPWRWDLKIPSARDCFSLATDADGHDERERIRDMYMIPFFGVTIEDLAICAAYWDANDPQLAGSIMTKSFAEIGDTEQRLSVRPWPKPCIERFQRAGVVRVLPPVLAFVAHAAFAQSAQTNGAHSLAGYTSSGTQVTAKSILDDLPTRLHGRQQRSTRLFASSAFLQTLPLAGKEPQDFAPVDGWGDAWVAQALDQVGIHEGLNVPTIGDDLLGAMICHHPAFLSRPGDNRRQMVANRPVVTWQGLTARESAAVNLIIIMDEVEGWIGRYGHDVPVEPAKIVKRRAVAGKARAIAAIRLAWLETSNRTVFTEEARRILLQQEKEQNPGTKGNEIPGETGEIRKARLDAFQQKIRSSAMAASIESLDVNDFGDSLWRCAKLLQAAGVGAMGQPGWRNFAHPHLWFRDDASQLGTIEGLAAWTHGLAEKILGRGAPDGVVAAMTVKGRGAVNRKRRSSRKCVSTAVKEQKIAARAFQMLGLMLTPHSTDPMLRVLVIRQLAKHEESSQTEKLQT